MGSDCSPAIPRIVSLLGEAVYLSISGGKPQPLREHLKTYNCTGLVKCDGFCGLEFLKGIVYVRYELIDT